MKIPFIIGFVLLLVRRQLTFIPLVGLEHLYLFLLNRFCLIWESFEFLFIFKHQLVLIWFYWGNHIGLVRVPFQSRMVVIGLLVSSEVFLGFSLEISFTYCIEGFAFLNIIGILGVWGKINFDISSFLLERVLLECFFKIL